MRRRAAFRWIALASLLAACAGDRSDGDESSTATAQPVSTPAPATGGAPPHACELITMDEIRELAPAVVLRNRVSDEPTWSECHWEGTEGPLIMLKVYASGGRQAWDTWRRAQGMAEVMLKQSEGVSLDSVVQQGLVRGLGDAAYFSPVLPSLILEGDVLLELTMPGVANPERKFRRLASAMLDRIS
ncbi:MAG TPA: DUF3558 family protein [Gemmatimonadaceae bacterium]|nr:DUF3558 family protein [Gemmatimonadaceae bacterium]